jgi:hypothetical protein
MAVMLSGLAPLRAQIVRGQVVDSVTETPLAGGAVILLMAAGEEVGRTITDSEGLFLLRAEGPGTYRLRVEADGYRASEFPPFDLATDAVRGYVLLVAALGSDSTLHGSDRRDAEAIIERVCPEGAPAGLPVILGLVYDQATGTPVAGAEVLLSWSPVPDVLAGHVLMEDAQGTAVSGPSGFYGVCGAPTETRLLLRAVSDAALSEMVGLRFDDGGVYRRGTFTPMDARVWRQDLPLRPYRLGTALVRGSVTDTAGRLVPDAIVSVSGTDISTRTNFLGDFRLAGLPPGDLRLAAEHVGYRPTQRDLEVAAGDSLTLPRGFLQLTPAPIELQPVTVAAPAPERRRDLTEFLRRRETTQGSFITREEFERTGNVQRTTDVLQRMRGVNVRPGYGWLEWLVTTRRGTSRGSSGAQCFPLVFMDGSYVGTTANLNVDQLIPVAGIEAIEVHAGAASIPPEFNRLGSTCGVIAFWTR